MSNGGNVINIFLNEKNYESNLNDHGVVDQIFQKKKKIFQMFQPR
jgi:hypothetical protein